MTKYHILSCVVISLSLSMLTGCSSSDESTKQTAAIETLNASLTTMKSQNDSLKVQLSNLQRDNQSANTRATDLQSQVNDLKTKLAAASPPAPEKPQTAAQPVSKDMRTAYEECLKMFRERNYEQAATTLQSLLDGGIDIDLQDNCHYWLGECSYAMKKYAQAIEHFQKVFTFKVSEKKDDAQIMIANSYYALGDKEKAKAEYQKFLDKFPASPYVQRAKERLAKL